MRKYYCPVCGKEHEQLTNLKNCIAVHERDEKRLAEEKAKKERDEKAKELQSKISEVSKNLEKLIADFNNLRTGKTYTVNVYVADEGESFNKIFRDLLGL